MKTGKTIVTLAAGVLVIVFGLFYALFGSFDFSRLLGSTEYSYSAKELQKLGRLTALNTAQNLWSATEDDAYFLLELPNLRKLKEIRLDLEETNAAEPAQIYYSPTMEMDGGHYWEFQVKDGVNVVMADNSPEVKYLRFDLTAHTAEHFKVNALLIAESDEYRMQYLFFTPLLSALYMAAAFASVNKQFLLQKIRRNAKANNKFELIDQTVSLAVNDFKSRFSGAYLGLFWGVIQPLSTIILFWFVFQVGFRSNPIEDVPFILWLAAGMIPWNYFYDAWFGGTAAFTSYGYIVKKVVFKIEVLPLVKVLSSFILNLVFNGILIVIYGMYGRWPGLHIFDMLYFSFCLFVLALALSYITATLNVFIKDVGQFMGIILQTLMWMTPMMWSYDMVPLKYAWFYKLNPLHYVINGYRESLIHGRWFCYHWVQMLWFWTVALVLLFAGRSLMYRMKDHFADVL